MKPVERFFKDWEICKRKKSQKYSPLTWPHHLQGEAQELVGVLLPVPRQVAWEEEGEDRKQQASSE